MAKSKILFKIQNARLTALAIKQGWTSTVIINSVEVPNPVSSIQYGLNYLVNKLSPVLTNEILRPLQRTTTPDDFDILRASELLSVKTDVNTEVVAD